jgi:hypothetical protein
MATSRRPEPGRAPEMPAEKSIEVAAFMGAAGASQGDETSPLRLGCAERPSRSTLVLKKDK